MSLGIRCRSAASLRECCPRNAVRPAKLTEGNAKPGSYSRIILRPESTLLPM
jgi:hypothetical protein